MAAYRDLLAMCARYDTVFARWLKEHGVSVATRDSPRTRQRGPKIDKPCVCKNPKCARPFLAGSKATMWCPECRPKSRGLMRALVAARLAGEA